MNSREKKLEAFGRLLDVMDRLREDCPWNAAQTQESLRYLSIEEIYELSDAIMQNDDKEVRKELGDLLYHIVFYARIAQEKGLYDIADVINVACDKMIFRHPHVFAENRKDLTAEDIADNWELMKTKEKDGNKTILSGVPNAMPPILKSIAMQEKASGVGFDWNERDDVWEKVREEEAELETEIKNIVQAKSEDEEIKAKKKAEGELGDFIFAMINAGRLYGLNPETALNRTCDKFRRRFTYVEEQTIKKGKSLKEMTLAEMDVFWDEAKKLEKASK